jgi:hypothetical protein
MQGREIAYHAGETQRPYGFELTEVVAEEEERSPKTTSQRTTLQAVKLWR